MKLWIATDTQYAGTSVFVYIKFEFVYMYNTVKPAKSLDVLTSLWSIDSLITHLSERSAMNIYCRIISDANDSYTTFSLA